MSTNRSRLMAITIGATFAATVAVMAPGIAQAATCGGYTVRAGDTLSALAQRDHTTVATLANVNHIANPNFIVVGQCLSVSIQSAPAAPSTPNAPYSYQTPPQAPSQGGSLSSTLTQAANDHGVSPALVRAIAWQESNWNQAARGYSGEVGMMQILPGTAAMLNSQHGTQYNLWTAYGNAELGAMFLHDLIGQNGGCLTCAISAYNQGQGNYNAHGLRNYSSYVAPVLNDMTWR